MDYAKPTTAGEVCKRIADDLRVRATHLRNDAAVLQARADELEKASREVEKEASQYERWQPAVVSREDDTGTVRGAETDSVGPVGDVPTT